MPMSMSAAAVRGTTDGCPGRAAGGAPVISFSAMIAAHSTGGGGWRPAGWLVEVLLLGLLPTAAAIAAPAAPPVDPMSAPQPGAQWRAVEGRIEGDYFEQDAAGLESLATALAGPDDASADGKTDEWRSYYGALIAYRLALLA